MKILTFSTLYPNHVRPHQGIFVENRIRRLAETRLAEIQVVSPIPWFPFPAQRFGRYGEFARVRGLERRFGIPVWHPRYPVIPKIGMTMAPALMYASVWPAIARLPSAGFDFDLIDAHYLYPDGVVAAMLARKLDKPLVLTARGSDINRIAGYRLPRRMIRWAADRATALVAVCQALKDEMGRMGLDESKIHVLRNGVDLVAFRPIERGAHRRSIGAPGPVLLMVGNLVPLKGHDLAIRALAHLPGALLLVAGEGPREGALRSLAASLGLSRCVRFLGAVPHAQLREVYNAVDMLLLPSESEGMANVLLEAMACGTPVVASNAGGASEVISVGCSGSILPERTPAAIANAVGALLRRPLDRSEVRRHAEQFGWEATTRGQLSLFEQAIGKSAGIPLRLDRQVGG